MSRALLKTAFFLALLRSKRDNWPCPSPYCRVLPPAPCAWGWERSSPGSCPGPCHQQGFHLMSKHTYYFFLLIILSVILTLNHHFLAGLNATICNFCEIQEPQLDAGYHSSSRLEIFRKISFVDRHRFHAGPVQTRLFILMPIKIRILPLVLLFTHNGK